MSLTTIYLAHVYCRLESLLKLLGEQRGLVSDTSHKLFLVQVYNHNLHTQGVILTRLLLA